MKSLRLVLMIALVSFLFVLGTIPARAQATPEQSKCENGGSCLLLLPSVIAAKVDEYFARIEHPVVPSGYRPVISRKVDIVDGFTEANGHVRLWFAISGQLEDSDIFWLKYDDWTYLPDSEKGDTVPAYHFFFQVKDNNGVDLDAFKKHLEDAGQYGMAHELDVLRKAQATVLIVQMNRTWLPRWGVPVFEAGVLAVKDKFFEEVWRNTP